MQNEDLTKDIYLTVSELLRIRAWYRVYASDRSTCITERDMLLDSKLRDHRYDMTDRDTESALSLRIDTPNMQYAGRERSEFRKKHTTPRMLRPVVKPICN